MTQDAFTRLGKGEPLLCLVSEDFADGELAQILAERYCLLLPQKQKPDASAIAREAGAGQMRILASDGNCLEAMDAARALDDKAGPVVLLSPPAVENIVGSDAPKFQTLALFGTRGAPVPAAGAFKRSVSASHIMYVFDAVDLERERPQAVAEAALDFLARSEGFLVNNLDGRLFA